MKTKKSLKPTKEKGITLIALVITIIVLIILAGVTLNLIFKDGIISKSETATYNYKIQSYKEQISLLVFETYMDQITGRLGIAPQIQNTIQLAETNQEQTLIKYTKHLSATGKAGTKTLKELVIQKLEDENWVGNVEETDDSIIVITRDNYRIEFAVTEDGQVDFIADGREDGEPYPTLDIEQIALEGKENEKIKLKVTASVDKKGKTKKIATIENVTTGENKKYEEGGITFEVEENGTYTFRATTDQGKSKSKKININIQGTNNKITIVPETTEPRNTEKRGEQNGKTTGPLQVTITYGETNLQKQYITSDKPTKINKLKPEETSITIEVEENVTIAASFTDGKNVFNSTTYNIKNIDNEKPTITNIQTTLDVDKITVTADIEDTASQNADEGTKGIQSIKYKLGNGAWQNSNILTAKDPGTFTVTIKAIDKAGNEKEETKENVTVPGWTVEVAKGEGIASASAGTTNVIRGKSTTITATATTGYHFKEWAINGGVGTLANVASTSSSSTTVTPTGNIKLIAKAESDFGLGTTVTGENRTFNGQAPAYNNPIIPVGFKAVNKGATWGSSDGWNNGLVIEDGVGNEFVWVPVDGTDIKYEKVSYAGNDAQSGTDEIPTKVTTWYSASKYTNKEKGQIEDYGGFYIARYEAGTTLKTKSARNPTTDASIPAPLSKPKQWPWNYVSYTTAKKSSEKMYSTANVQSGLITGTQWDAVMQWYGETSSSNDTSWGNYKNKQLTDISAYSGKSGDWDSSYEYGVSGQWTTASSQPSTTGCYLIKTGDSETTKKKNIYDIAGNLWEWTTEKYSSSGPMCRGGGFGSSGSVRPAGCRSYDSETNTDSNIGFRAVLYIVALSAD